MGSESVGSNNNPILNFNKSQAQEYGTPEGQLPNLRNVEMDTCFCCKKQGHWASDCPDKLKKKTQSPTVGRTDGDQSIPEDKPCPCGGGNCIVRTSTTEYNPGRKFYRCPLPMATQCAFFHWCDQPSSDQWIHIPRTSYPMCRCGAGECGLRTSTKYNGRPFFVCPVKKGEGSCGFIQWANTLTNTLSGGRVDENKHSPRLTIDGQERIMRTNENQKTEDGNKLKGIASPVSKEEMVRLDSIVLNDIISPSKDNITVPATTCQCFPESSHPVCPCGAGLCTRLTQKEGENKGRSYFVCPVAKGEGACSFSQWDVQEKTNPIDGGNKHEDGDKCKGIGTPIQNQDKEEMVRLDSNSMVFTSTLVTPVRNLKSNEEKRSVLVGKAGQCLWCGEEGHWSKECITNNPPCFRCGKSGHWMKDCIA